MPADNLVLVVAASLQTDRGEPGLLDPTERARLQRMGSRRKAREYVLGRTVVRRALGAALGRPASTLRFSYGRHGKPGFTDSAAVHFNLSHSGEIVAVAVAPFGPLGFDLEEARPGRPFARLAQRFFAPAEAEWFAAQPAADRRDAFYRLWTLKEAYLKAIGTGLSVPSRSFEIDAAATPPRLVKAPPDELGAENWSLTTVDLSPVAPPGEIPAALCTPAARVDYRLITLSKITGETR